MDAQQMLLAALSTLSGVIVYFWKQAENRAAKTEKKLEELQAFFHAYFLSDVEKMEAEARAHQNRDYDE